MKESILIFALTETLCPINQVNRRRDYRVICKQLWASCKPTVLSDRFSLSQSAE